LICNKRGEKISHLRENVCDQEAFRRRGISKGALIESILKFV